MQGRLAGVNIIQDGGTPAVVSKLKLEVATAFVLMEMNHYILLMEFPIQNESIGSANTSTALPSQASPLNSIANDESIEVLKDADATAIYGSRGANGVY
jgi:TonB-dependent SusC/RagA subfamily outer membrane receptor